MQTINKSQAVFKADKVRIKNCSSRGNLWPSQKKLKTETSSSTVSAFDEWTLSASRKQQLFTKVCSWLWSLQRTLFCECVKKSDELWKYLTKFDLNAATDEVSYALA